MIYSLRLLFAWDWLNFFLFFLPHPPALQFDKKKLSRLVHFLNLPLLLGLLYWGTIPFTVLSQDIHWSQYNDNPVFQNPGNAGNFHGDLRLVGNFRDQWRAVSVPFQTISVSGDSKLYKHKDFGFGGLFFHDATGDGRFRTTELQLNGAYLFRLTADSTHVVRPGMNIGMNSRQINWSKLQFGNQYNGMAYDVNLPSKEAHITDGKTNISLGVGAVYSFRMSKGRQLDGGVALFNLNRPDQGFYGERILRSMRTNVFVRMHYPIDFDWDLIPSVQFSMQGDYRELVLGSSVKYTLINRLADYRAVYAGLWHRAGDAFFFSVGMDYQQWYVGLSYDINVSSLTVASHVRGGFEIAVRYILFRFIPKQTIHRICPDFI